METEKSQYANCNVNYHVVWIPKHRKKVLRGKAKELIKKLRAEQSS